MSKSTNRYGKIQFHATAGIDANPIPSDQLKEEQAALDDASKKKFGSKGIHKYKDLTGQQKSDLHYDLNVARQQAKKKKRKEEEDVED